jgi:hypothetical protein
MLNTIMGQMDLKIIYDFLDDELLTERISDNNETGIYAVILQK